MVYYLIYLGISFFITWILISFFQFIGKKYYCYPEPTKDMPSYRRKVTFLGGGPLFFGFVSALLMFLFWKFVEPGIELTLTFDKIIAIVIAAGIIFFVELLHDLHEIPNFLRITGKFLAAIILIYKGFKVELFSSHTLFNVDIFGYQLHIIDTIISIIWFFIIIYCINKLEALDGIIVGMALIISLFIFAISIFSHNFENALFAAIFAGALTGIIWEQLAPPEILLGKTGSTFIGFILAMLSLNLNLGTLINQDSSMLIPIILLASPLTLTAVIIGRKLLGKAGSYSFEELYKTLKVNNITTKNMMTATFVLTTVAGLISIAVFSVSNQIIAYIFMIIAVIIISLTIAKLCSYESAEI